ncbi:MAG: helicase, partial [Chloroflexi bacterium]|nr:helicase [Chloroflexota bacterium]
MDSIFITNDSSQGSLKDRINQLTKEAEELKFLVGFCYFSGIYELYDGLLKNDQVILKILVGLNVDKLNHELIEFGRNEPNLTANQHTEQLLKDIRFTFNGQDFDNKEFYERIGLFIKMLREDRLIIRKTRLPNHSKVYIFIDYDNPFRDRTFITGSSNLTRSGLTGAEFNVEISDFGVRKAEGYFDDLWADAIEITEHDESKWKLIRLLEKETLTREITPFEAYALCLKTYIDVYNPDRPLGDSVIEAFKANGYTPYQYQLDAIKQALNIIEQNHGVIIADVVGLGKSVIASAVAKALKKRGMVLCPPGLMGDKNKTSGWSMYMEQFGLTDWEVRSSGDLEKAAKFVQKTNDIEVIIVDEVHRFRNQDTQDYEHLKNICRGKKVILLTATPVNNRPNDIAALLNLFIAPKQSIITLNPNLGATFRSYNYQFERLSHIMRYHNSPDEAKLDKAQSNYETIFGEPTVDLAKVQARLKAISKDIRDIISPVTIRRNRLDLQHHPDYAKEVKNLSKVADPQEWYFDLSPEQSQFYDQIITQYFGPEGRFTGAVYQPFSYETPQKKDELSEKESFEYVSQFQLSDFMRRLIVKRFESSFGSFEQSIRRFKKLYENALSFITSRKQYILDSRLIEKIYEEDDEVIDRALQEYQNKLETLNFPKRDKIYNVNRFHQKDQFLHDIQADIDMFTEIISKLDEMDLVSDDPKSGCLIEHLKEELRKPPKKHEPKRKIIIFSEYADTVAHLKLALRPVFDERMLVVDGSLSPNVIQTINQNFDASNQDPKDDYDILLSTDRISEGFNLNRAGMIINYDIPWNPVRVIQRVGRINRISKKVFDELYIVNFFPTDQGATTVKSLELAASKMFLIHNTLGEYSKIFDIDEEPTPAGLFTRITHYDEDLEG